MTHRSRYLFLYIIVLFLLLIPFPVEASPSPQNGTGWQQVTSCDTVGDYTYCLSYWYTTDCDGWSTTFYWDDMWTDDPRYYVMIRQWGSDESGTWSTPNVIESYPFYYIFTWHDSEMNFLHFQTISFTIFEPSECEPNAGQTDCALTPQYFMYTLQDAGQPLGWQPFCYIISSNGFPSVETQARVCTVPGSDHTYRATNQPYAGWVYTDCHGMPYYGWPAWDPAWYHDNTN
ncbi:MAG: hypothetical protein JXA97_01905 [Anaerolineales bacterium]|nr:hypothetical protein [Anaerolineales bacterium]